jgi:putative transposase
LAVLPANVQDWDGAEEVIGRCGGLLPRLARVWADAGYKAFAAWVIEHCRWVLDIVSKRPGQTTFEVQKWRWIVERTFGWFGRYRRLSKDYEHNPKIGPWRPCFPDHLGGSPSAIHLGPP